MRPSIAPVTLFAALAFVLAGCGSHTAPETAPEDERPAREVEDAKIEDSDMRAFPLSAEETEFIGRGGVEPSMGTDAPSRARPAPRIQAASHDDNEEYLSWQEYLSQWQDFQHVRTGDYSVRIIVRVTDADGRPLMGRRFRVESENGARLWSASTYPNGENVVFPATFFNDGDALAARVVLEDETSAPWEPGLDGIIPLATNEPRTERRMLPVDVAFVMDATGSMGDEIQQLKDVVFSIHSRLRHASDAAEVRFALVTYRDRGDVDPLHVVPFTANVDSFEIALSAVEASGGGDYPEDLESGLAAALNKLAWRDDGIRSVFLVADAPPHSERPHEFDYLRAAREANSRAIRVHMVGASGLRPDGEFIFRQIAASTYGRFIFLTYGETGESSGGGTIDDPGRVSHHTGENFASRRLDDIVVDLIRKDMAYQVDVPLLVSDNPPPAAEEEMLELRMKNLWGQIARQVSGAGSDSVTAVLMPFENALGDTALATYLRDLSVELLVPERAVKLVERDRIDAILAEHELAATGLVEVSQAVELGNLLGSRLVLLGKIYRLGTDRVVHVRAVDSETARIVAAARVRV